MKTSIKNAAGFLAVAIWADGVYTDEEKENLTDIAEALQVDLKELETEVDSAVKSLDEMDDEAVQDFLVEHASSIEDEDAKVLMQCALDIVLADDVITKDEVQVLFELGDAMGNDVDNADIALMLLDLVKYDPEVDVKF